MKRFTSIGAMLIGLVCGASSRADFFLDLTSITAGGPGVGKFAGTLGSVGVTGSILPGPPVDFVFGGLGVGIGNSTIDGSSPAPNQDFVKTLATHTPEHALVRVTRFDFLRIDRSESETPSKAMGAEHSAQPGNHHS